MNRKIIFAIVALAAIGLSLIEFKLKKDGVIARQENIPPTSAVLLKVETTEDSTMLIWEGVSEDIQQYNVYRKVLGEKDWHYLEGIKANGANVYRFKDMTIEPDADYLYEIYAAFDANDIEGERVWYRYAFDDPMDDWLYYRRIP